MTTVAMENAQFEKCAVAAKYEYFSKLEKIKIGTWQLDEAEVPISAITGMSNSTDGKSDKSIELSMESLSGSPKPSVFETVIMGTLKCHNTIENYKAVNWTEVLHTEGDKKWQLIKSGEWLEDPNALFSFKIECFADIKVHKFYWKVCNPMLFPTSLVQRNGDIKKATSLLTMEEGEKLEKRDLKCPVFAMKEGNPIMLSELNPTDSTDISLGKILIVVYDPCSSSTRQGWTVRNVIFALCYHFKIKTVSILGLRSILSSSLVLNYHCQIPDEPEATWIRMAGSLQQQETDLSRFMDDKLLAEESAKLNLSLMKWRMVPDLPLDSIAKKKCLLVGSGTLGCGVARNLMKWGIFDITFIDRGIVSFSNPVRQNLFTHADAVARTNKAVAAAAACKLIYPLAKTKAVDMAVPMPGHPVSDKQKDEIAENIDKFDRLVAQHDAVFLLTDSREARWLPTMVATRHNKIAINSALGFDNYVAMRHGSTAKHPNNNNRVSCYFCQDITEPTDTLKDRTLDQQCTVTRPGISDIAAANAVELFISTITHHHGYEANQAESGMLGSCPHQVRGSMQDFVQRPIYGMNYDACIGCSPKIISEYEKRGSEFVIEVLRDPTVLPKLTGLQESLDAVRDADFEMPSDCSEED